MSNLQRLDKVLSNLEFGSRKEIRLLMKQERVKVNDTTVKDPGIQVDPETSIIKIDDREIMYKKYIYIMMNKPDGVISATFDKRHKTVVNLLPGEFKRFDVFPAGRLDIDTEGLILLTNDGQLAHEILSPKKHIPKTYFARVRGLVDSSDIEKFSGGITLDDGYRTFPAQLEVLNSSEVSEVKLTIYEGKFHQVKRMFQVVEKEVIYLKRISMGGLILDNSLALGECRELTKAEVREIKVKC